MSTIDPKHIDEWLFNHFEGNLSRQDSETLARFLNANPALKADYDAWKASYVTEPPMAYPNAGELLQPVPAPAIKKWIGRGLLLLVALGLLIFFLLPEPAKTELPEEPVKEQPAVTPATKEAPTVHAPSPGEVKKTEAVKKTPGPAANAISTAKGISPNSTNVEPSETTVPFLMQRHVDTHEMLSNSQSPSSDSLEIIVRPQSASHPGGKATKLKTRKKPMTVIRIRDTGF